MERGPMIAEVTAAPSGVALRGAASNHLMVH